MGEIKKGESDKPTRKRSLNKESCYKSLNNGVSPTIIRRFKDIDNNITGGNEGV